MRFGGLGFFERVSDGSLNLIARHPWWSLTWTFLLNVGWQNDGLPRRGFRVWYCRRATDRLSGRLLWTVRFHWMRQNPMPHVMKYRQRHHRV